MNNAENFPIDIDEQRDWLNAHKDATGHSWPILANRIGLKSGTISVFAGNKYQGNNDNIARNIFKYRQMLDSQAEVAVGIPVEPGYFETMTSRRLMGLLTWAHQGRITLAATGPGTGKTKTIHEYRDSASNVWIATMEEVTKRPMPMINTVLRALGVPARGAAGAAGLSQLVKEHVSHKRGLLIIDEANHLETASIEQLRAWHDATGVGLCLLGNEELLMRIESGSRRDAYGRLNSRIAQRHLQHVPVAEDVDAFCDAWVIADDGMRDFLKRIALTPASGGLRECQQLIEQASILAVEDGQSLSLGHLRDAQSTRATRFIRA